MTIDLFRPYVSQLSRTLVHETLSPNELGRTYIGEGPNVAVFEQVFAREIGSDRPVLALNSCTSAIDLALHLCGVGVRQHPSWPDEVITTPMTCTATNAPIVLREATPIWADVDPLTGLIDPSDVARKVTAQTKAIIAVDWAGRSCDYEALKNNWNDAEHSGRRIPVIQDAAHNPYARGGDYVCYSFGPIKHLTCGGHGGALITPPDQYERARLLRWYGLDRLSKADFRCEQDITEVGGKSHLTDVDAAIGLGNLPDLSWIIARHRENAQFYCAAFDRLPDIEVPAFDPDCGYWIFDVLVDKQRDNFQRSLREHGIETSRVHRRNDEHPAYHFPNGPLPGVDAFDSRHVCIPVGWWISSEDRQHIADRVRSWSLSGQAVTA